MCVGTHQKCKRCNPYLAMIMLPFFFKMVWSLWLWGGVSLLGWSSGYRSEGLVWHFAPAFVFTLCLPCLPFCVMQKWKMQMIHGVKLGAQEDQFFQPVWALNRDVLVELWGAAQKCLRNWESWYFQFGFIHSVLPRIFWLLCYFLIKAELPFGDET